MAKAEKRALRAQMRLRRRAEPDQKRKSEAACEALTRMEVFARARCVMGYMAIGDEIDPAAALDAALRAGKRVCVPVCGARGEMRAVEIHSLRGHAPGAFGIPEPQGETVEPQEIDLMICPGLAFDKSGGRLGYGKGYYDRFLPKTRAFLVGMCYDDCIVDRVPVTARDVPMNALACETGILNVGGKE